MQPMSSFDMRQDMLSILQGQFSGAATHERQSCLKHAVRMALLMGSSSHMGTRWQHFGQRLQISYYVRKSEHLHVSGAVHGVALASGRLCS